MKKTLLFIILISNLLSAQMPFKKGVNLSNWFQSNSPPKIQFTKYTKQDFIYLKSMGCNLIRLPINMHAMTDGTPEHSLNPFYIFLLDQVVDWAEEVEINLILDNHSFSSSVATDPNIDKILIPVWKNMAEHFKDKSNLLYYEILNEPHGISNFKWNKIQESAITAIREIDTAHTIIVGASNFYGYSDLDSLTNYSDKNLIYTFHFYEPFLFTHQGADWTSISMKNITKIPFPFNESKMPRLSKIYANTWIESIYNNYKIKGTFEHLEKLLNITKNFMEKRKVPIFCGEFGVLGFHSSVNDRIKWYNFITKYFNENQILWTVWDYNGEYFGLLNPDNSLEENKLLFDAIGLNYIEKKTQNKTVNKRFPIFINYVEKGILPIKSSSSETLSYSIVQQSEGNFSILWRNTEKFNSLIFDFLPDINLSSLLQKGVVLSLKIKTDSPQIKFDIRFVDSKNNTEDHPWRSSFIINADSFNSYKTWHEIKIPLTDFKEKGSWDNGKWYNPKEKFDWTKIDKLEFALEHKSLIGKTIWFDDIVIE